jgi:hypothetical protein
VDVQGALADPEREKPNVREANGWNVRHRHQYLRAVLANADMMEIDTNGLWFPTALSHRRS